LFREISRWLLWHSFHAIQSQRSEEECFQKRRRQIIFKSSFRSEKFANKEHTHVTGSQIHYHPKTEVQPKVLITYSTPTDMISNATKFVFDTDDYFLFVASFTFLQQDFFLLLREKKCSTTKKTSCRKVKIKRSCHYNNNFFLGISTRKIKNHNQRVYA